MSTFLGLIKEIPGISVDCFNEENLTSSIFFLSHCHTDHMLGLSDAFFQHLEQYNKHLYCSSITKVILENKYSILSSCIKDLDINSPTVIEYKVEDNHNIIITVTCVSAGHCPGSVMFLFEKGNESVLYTGDFRINPTDFPNLKKLHYRENSRSVPKVFNKIYLDTTMLNKNFLHLPTRKDSIIKICNITREWLSKDPRNVVILECSALYGSEFIFMELSKFLKMKIHVREYVYESYCRIPELSPYVTNDAHSTSIHACKPKFSSPGLKCRNDVDTTNVVTIIPSVMKWKGKDTTKVGEWDETSERTYNVCYSTHASFNELKAFVQYFKPLQVFPCVAKEAEKDEIYSLLHEIVTQSENIPSNKKETYNLKLSSHKTLFKFSLNSTDFSDDDDDNL